MKIKSILIIAATLVIGFVIGFLTNAQLTKNKIRSVVNMGTASGFKTRFYHMIGPDAAQRKAIDPILDKYGEEVHESVFYMRGEMKKIHEEMMNDLEPYLTPAQMERLERNFGRMQRGWKGYPDNRAPHHRWKKNKNPGKWKEKQ